MENLKNIPLVILAGGRGTRISEYTLNIPKPMIKIGRIPILKHIINYYESFGVNKILIAAGYKKELIQDYFKNKKNVKIIDTGLNTLTGGRLLRLKKNLNDVFFLTYGDGLSNVNIKKLYNFHIKNKKIATVTAVHPVARFGEIILKKNTVVKFNEKPRVKNDWINGGFFVFNKNIFEYLNNDKTILENEPMKSLTKKNQLSCFRHEGFWQCMDTLREKMILDDLNKSKNCPWKKK